MRKIFLILVAVATMAFAQNSFRHGMVLGLGAVSVGGSGADMYDRTGDVGVGVKFGWNFLIPIEPFISFHTGADLKYQVFIEDHEDEYDHWMEMWQTGLQVPLTIRSSWKDLYAELGARLDLKLGSGWETYYDDIEENSGSLDDVYKRYHLGMLAAVGLMINEVDLNLTVGYDLTSATKDIGNGETKNLTIDFDIIIWFGGKK